MTNKQIASLILLIGGVVLALLALTADVIGLGLEAGFGPAQWGALIVGALAAIAGLFLWRQK